MNKKLLILAGLALGAYLLSQSKEAAAQAVKTADGNGKETTPESSAVAAATAKVPEITNPAISSIPPWTDSPTQGEIELQAQLAAATDAGQNLAPILESAYGPAWNLMVITQADWDAKLASGWTVEQLKAAYTTSEAERTATIKDYWIATHPGEEVPDVLKTAAVDQVPAAAAAVAVPAVTAPTGNIYGMDQADIDAGVDAQIAILETQIVYPTTPAQSEAAVTEIWGGIIEVAASGGNDAWADYIAGGGILY